MNARNTAKRGTVALLAGFLLAWSYAPAAQAASGETAASDTSRDGFSTGIRAGANDSASGFIGTSHNGSDTAPPVGGFSTAGGK